MDDDEDRLVLAVPKGRILDDLLPILARCAIVPEEDFQNENSRKLRFHTNDPALDLIRVRAFDVATFVAFGAAHLGVVGSDVLEEFDYEELYAPVDLGIGACRLSVATPCQEPVDAHSSPQRGWSHVRVATKYPNLTRKYFARKGVQAECVVLSGAMEIAPPLGLAGQIVDLVSSGATLAANGLCEGETLMAVTSRLIVNRTAMKTRSEEMRGWITRFRAAA